MNKVPLNISAFFGLTVIFPLIDFFNGFFLTSGVPFPLGVLYRFFFFFFLIVMILTEEIPKSIFTLVVVIFILGNISILLTQSIFLQNPLSWIIEDISVFVKYFLWVLIPYYIYQRKEVFKKINYEDIFIYISFFFTLGLLVPYILGVGNQTYIHSNTGYKGYFFANNDTSFAFIVSITFTARSLMLQLHKKWSKYLIFLIFLYAGNMVCLLLVGTKTGIIYGTILSIIVWTRLLFVLNYQSIMQKIFVWLASIFLGGWVVLRGIAYAIEIISGTYERTIYFYYLYNGDLIRLLTSSRSDFLEGGMYYFLMGPTPIFTLLFGQGFESRLEQFGRLGLIEMDFFDSLFGLGIFGIILLILPLGYFSVTAIKNQDNKVYSYTFLVILFYGFFAGHVLFSALSSTLFGLVCGGIILSKKE